MTVAANATASPNMDGFPSTKCVSTIVDAVPAVLITGNDGNSTVPITGGTGDLTSRIDDLPAAPIADDTGGNGTDILIVLLAQMNNTGQEASDVTSKIHDGVQNALVTTVSAISAVSTTLASTPLIPALTPSTTSASAPLIPALTPVRLMLRVPLLGDPWPPYWHILYLAADLVPCHWHEQGIFFEVLEQESLDNGVPHAPAHLICGMPLVTNPTQLEDTVLSSTSPVKEVFNTQHCALENLSIPMSSGSIWDRLGVISKDAQGEFLRRFDVRHEVVFSILHHSNTFS
ncbi:hypothetical protein EDD22DRAFT_851866 [Suillus occidentalis]|nr:hypothetical protein EDD22DRAFT_851866 [Suillus occidentalis]